MGNIENTGIIRKVDELDRIVLPIEVRKHLGLKEHEELAITLYRSNASWLELIAHEWSCTIHFFIYAQFHQ